MCVLVCVLVCVCVLEREKEREGERERERETINVKSFGDKLRRMGCVWKEEEAEAVLLL